MTKTPTTTAALKKLLKAAGLQLSSTHSTRVKGWYYTSEGVAFSWASMRQHFGALETPRHSVSYDEQTLRLDVETTSSLTDAAGDARRAAAQAKQADQLAQVLTEAGVAFTRVGASFTLPTFTRVLAEGWGKRTNRRTPRFKGFKKVLAELPAAFRAQLQQEA